MILLIISTFTNQNKNALSTENSQSLYKNEAHNCLVF